MWKANDGGAPKPASNPQSSASAPAGGAAPAGSWRLGGGGGAAAAAGESTATRALVHDPNRQGYLVWYYLGLIFAMMLLLGGIILWYILRKTTATPFVAVAITQYEDWRVPPNTLAYEDLDAFRRIWPDERWQNVRFRSSVESATSGTARTAKELLAQVHAMLADAGAPGGPDKQGVVLLYLSAHGVVQDKQPCLMLEKYRPFDPPERRAEALLPVSELLADLARGAFRQKYPNAHLVIFLDAQRLPHAWQLGMVQNTFGDRLAETLGKLPKDSLTHVVCAAGPGQEALAAPELGGTAFGHFTARGLFGEARELDGDGQSVSLRELAAYLDATIDRWADQHRGASQRVLVFPPLESSDLRLAFKPTASLRSLPTGFGDRRVLDALAKGAPQIDAARQKMEPLLAPTDRSLTAAERAWQQVRIQRLEDLWLGGEAYSQKLRERLADELPADEPGGTMWTPSLALANAWAVPSESTLRRRQGAEKLFAGLDAMRAEKKDKWLDSAAADGGFYPDSGAAGLKFLLANPARLGQRGELRDLISLTERVAANDKAKGRIGPPWTDADAIEIHFLRMLEAHLPWEDPAFKDQFAAVASALQTRMAAEAAVAPSDERSWAMLEVLAGPLDEQRRRSEDQLFVGTPGELAKAQKGWADLALPAGQGARSYPQLAATNRDLGNAWRLRDEVFANLPAVYEWALARLALEKNPEVAANSPASWPDQLQRTIERALVLERDFEKDPQDPKATEPPLAAAAALKADWQASLAPLRGDISELSDGRTLDGPTTRRLLHSIAAPPILLVDANNSTELRRLLIEALNRHFDQKATLDATGKITDAPPAFVRNNAYEQILIRRPNPLVRLLAEVSDEAPPPPPTEVGLVAFEADLTAAQQLLAARVEAIAVPHPSLVETAPTTARLRADFRQANRWQQRTYWLIGGMESALSGDWARPEQHDAAGEWQQFERRMLLAWHARRAADDFWGPRPGQSDPYFARAAEACEEVGGKIYDRLAANDKSLSQLLTARRAAAAQPLESRVEKTDLPTVDATIQIETRGDLPAGETAMQIRGGPVGEEQSLQVSLPSTADEPRYRQGFDVAAGMPGAIQLRFPADKLKGELRASALYRGHRWTGPIYPAGADRPETLVIELGPPPPPVLTVRGRVDNTIDIIFIFDCSRSMLAPVALPDGGRSTRFDIAKASFIELLQTLPPESSYRIELFLYGHRVGWDGSLDLPDDKLTRVTLEGVTLQNDVEQLFDNLKPYHPQLDTGALNDIQAKLRTAHARGYTPLYLSMSRALAMFRKFPQGKSSSRMVICITDGNNYVGQGQVGVQPPDVLREWGNTQPRIPAHVFFIGNEGRQFGVVSDTERLAKQTGGVFVPVNAPGEILEQVKKQIPLPVYVVTSPDQRIPTTVRHLNEPTQIMMPELRWNDEVRVAVKGNDVPTAPEIASMKLRLGGGEKISIESRGVQLTIPPYLRQLVAPGDFKKESLPDPFYWLALRESTRRGTGRLFPVMIERQDGAFTPQPRGLFVELQPRTREDPQPPPLFYSDLDFEPGHPIPVIRVATPSWDVAWVQADVAVWFSNDDTLGSLIEHRKKMPVGPMELFVETGPDLEGHALVITESPGPAATADSRPSLIWTSYRPQKIVHRRRPMGVWEHRYVFRDRKTAEETQVRAMPADEFKSAPTTYSTLFRALSIK